MTFERMPESYYFDKNPVSIRKSLENVVYPTEMSHIRVETVFFLRCQEVLDSFPGFSPGQEVPLDSQDKNVPLIESALFARRIVVGALVTGEMTPNDFIQDIEIRNRFYSILQRYFKDVSQRDREKIALRYIDVIRINAEFTSISPEFPLYGTDEEQKSAIKRLGFTDEYKKKLRLKLFQRGEIITQLAPELDKAAESMSRYHKTDAWIFPQLRDPKDIPKNPAIELSQRYKLRNEQGGELSPVVQQEINSWFHKWRREHPAEYLVTPEDIPLLTSKERVIEAFVLLRQAEEIIDQETQKEENRGEEDMETAETDMFEEKEDRFNLDILRAEEIIREIARRIITITLADKPNNLDTLTYESLLRMVMYVRQEELIQTLQMSNQLHTLQETIANQYAAFDFTLSQNTFWDETQSVEPNLREKVRNLYHEYTKLRRQLELRLDSIASLIYLTFKNNPEGLVE